MSEVHGLLMWTIYDRPSDYPQGHIARLFELRGMGGNSMMPTDEVVTGRLGFIRAFLRRQGLVCIPRHEDDEPTIVESWV